MPERYASLGEAIRARRLELGLTQAEVSERVGLDQAYLSKIERGWHVPRREHYGALAAAIGLSPEELTERVVWGDGPPAVGRDRVAELVALAGVLDEEDLGFLVQVARRLVRG